MSKSWVATRTLQSAGAAGTSIEIKIGAPEQFTEDKWRCAYSAAGEDSYAHGLDAFQSLVMALTGIRVAPDSSGQELSWVGGITGDHGIPRMVSHGLGLEFSRKIDSLIASEVSQFVEAASRLRPSK